MIETIVYEITYRRSKTEPQMRETRNTAEAAYRFALDIETNGGITIVTPIKQPIILAGTTRLTFED